MLLVFFGDQLVEEGDGGLGLKKTSLPKGRYQRVLEARPALRRLQGEGVPRGYTSPLPPLAQQMSPPSQLCLLTIVALILPSEGKTSHRLLPTPTPLQPQEAARWVFAKLKCRVPFPHSPPTE